MKEKTKPAERSRPGEKAQKPKLKPRRKQKPKSDTTDRERTGPYDDPHRRPA